MSVAMPLDDDKKSQSTVISAPSGFIESAQLDNTLSPEDEAWVESCLIYYPDIQGHKCDEIKDALLDIVVSYATSDHTKLDEVLRNNLEGGDTTETSRNLISPNMADDAFKEGYAAENSGKTECALNSVLPSMAVTHEHQDDAELENTDVATCSELSENILKCWNLSTHLTEDELSEQLRKSFSEISVPDLSQTSVATDTSSDVQGYDSLLEAQHRNCNIQRESKQNASTHDKSHGDKRNDHVDKSLGEIRSKADGTHISAHLLDSVLERENVVESSGSESTSISVQLQDDFPLTSAFYGSREEAELEMPAILDVGSELSNIFKIWDLDTQLGEGEFVDQLNEALNADFLPDYSPSPEVTFKDLGVDDLICGIADLSLDQWPD